MDISNKKYEFTENCFDILRLYSAFYVMTLHIMRHIHLSEVSPLFDWWNGVVVLFCISGFLVPASLERSKDIVEFLKKRVLRILPSLWVCIIVGIIVAALFCGFAFDGRFVQWFLGQLVFIRDLPQPDFITHFGIGDFQANLWTMIFTVQFYILTAALYPLLKNRSVKVWIAVLAGAMAFNIAVPYIQKVIPEAGKAVISHTCLPYFYIYFAGWFIYRYREVIVPYLANAKIMCAVLFIIRAVTCEKFGIRVGEYQDIVQVLLLCMLTIGIGYSFGKRRFKFDLSYGLYLYHMIIVDVFVQIGFVGNMKYVVMVYAAAVACAFASHYLVDDTVALAIKWIASKRADKKTEEESLEEVVLEPTEQEAEDETEKEIPEKEEYDF